MGWLLVVLLYVALAGDAGERYTVARGRVAEHPSQPCTFQLGSPDTLLVLHPASPYCQRLRELVKTNPLRVVVEPEE